MIIHASKFRRDRALYEAGPEGLTVIAYRLDGSDVGLYVKWFSNSFGTPLLARGTMDEIQEVCKSWPVAIKGMKGGNDANHI